MARIHSKEEHEENTKSVCRVAGMVLSGVRLETNTNAGGYATLTLRVQIVKPAGWIVDRLESNPNITIVLPAPF